MPATVLIVEDNPLNRKLFNDLLNAAEYDTLLCSDGSLVEDMVRKERPDLILMDIQLPNVSGLEITRRLKTDSDTASIPIIVVTAHAMMGDEENILSQGPDAYLAKPVVVEEFLSTVSQYLPPSTGNDDKVDN